jgi:hypothetical protein
LSRQDQAPAYLNSKDTLLNAGSTCNLMIFSLICLFLTQVCYLASGNVLGAREEFDKFEDIQRAFDQEPEGRFLFELLGAMEKMDAERFVNSPHHRALLK